MTRLLIVMAVTLFAFFVAVFTWNRAETVTCTAEGLEKLAPTWEKLADKRPRMAARELRKLGERTRIGLRPATYDELIDAWMDQRGEPDRRDCQRLQESIKRLW